MKQIPLTNMEDRWVHSTKEAFDALVAMGYTIHPEINSFDDLHDELIIKKQYIDSYTLEGGAERNGFKQAYYHNGNFYDQPYEEFTITEEKVPFPELNDIEWAMVDNPEWHWSYDLFMKDGMAIGLSGKHSFNGDDAERRYSNIKLIHENSKDFKVTWKLKEKINRKLHENRPLALAIGKVLDESRTACIDLADGTFLQYVSSTGEYFMVYSGAGTNVELYDVSACTLPDDYIIPEQVLQWMKEYQEQGIK